MFQPYHRVHRGLPEQGPQGQVFDFNVPPKHLHRWLNLPRHPLAHVVTRLRRQFHPHLYPVFAYRPQRELTCKQHCSRDVQLELSGVLQSSAPGGREKPRR